MSVLMRAKIQVQSILGWEGGEVIKATPVCKNEPYSSDGLDENNTFSKFTPSGLIELTITNPALLGQINEGDQFYVDFTKAE